MSGAQRAQANQNSLMDIPFPLLARVMTDWLETEDLGRLDASCCERSIRPNYLTQLQSVVLRDGYLPEDVELTRFLKWCISRRVKVKRAIITGRFLHVHPALLDLYIFRSVCGSELESLEFEEVDGTSWVPCAVLRRLSCKVTHLYLTKCAFWQSILAFLPQSLMDGLVGLIIACHVVSDEVNIPLGQLRFSNLKYLLIGHHCPSNIARKLIVGSPGIFTLVLQNMLFDDDQAIIAFNALGDSLTSLTLRGYAYMSDRGATALAAKCKKLMRLYCIGCPFIIGTSDTVSKFAANCRDLSTLALHGACDEDNLRAIGRHCKALKCLSLKDTGEGCNHGIRAVAAGCTSINRLWLEGFTDASTPALGSVSLLPLRTLALAKTRVTNAVLRRIAEQCQSLRVLCLYEATGYTAQGVMHLVQGCPNLRQVHIDINNAVLTKLVRLLWQQVRPEIRFIGSQLAHPTYG